MKLRSGKILNYNVEHKILYYKRKWLFQKRLNKRARKKKQIQLEYLLKKLGQRKKNGLPYNFGRSPLHRTLFKALPK